jgi:hypothetical protein
MWKEARLRGSCCIWVVSGCVLFAGCAFAPPEAPGHPYCAYKMPEFVGIHANEGTTTFIGVGCAHAHCAVCMLTKTQTTAPPPRVAPLPH